MKLLKLTRENLLPIVIFSVILLTGITVLKDYGVHYDEKCLINIGINNYRYINQGDQALLTFQDRYYGPFFELPLLIISNNIPAPGMIYFRHLMVFLTFYAGLIGIFFLGKRLFFNSRWSLLLVLLMVSSPRLFSDAFYNSKDIPFMVFFLFGIIILIRWIDLLDSSLFTAHAQYSTAALHAFVTAAATATRTPGIVLLGITIVVVILKTATQQIRVRRNILSLLIYIALTIGLTLLFMPVLWHDPLREFTAAFNQASHFNLWNVRILFLGTSIPASSVNWTYLPIWIGITTPYLVLGAFVLGIFFLGRAGVHRSVAYFWEKNRQWQSLFSLDNLTWLVIITWFIVPIAALYIFGSVLYDAWRQMFFIYPAILVIAVYGIKQIYRWLIRVFPNQIGTKIIFSLMLLIGLLEPACFMIRYHPYENVYFNTLAGDPATLRQRFELDYWGLSYKQGIDFILANDPRDHIVLSAVGPASLYVEYMLPREQAARITFTEPENADYFLTNYRWHPEDFNYPEKYYSIFVRGTEIMTVYRIKLTDSGG